MLVVVGFSFHLRSLNQAMEFYWLVSWSTREGNTVWLGVLGENARMVFEFQDSPICIDTTSHGYTEQWEMLQIIY